MRTFRIIALLAIALLINNEAWAQKKTLDTQFRVDGICQMCVERIEAAVDVKGVKFAEYRLEDQTLRVVYKPQHISEAEIHALLNAAGHDTEKSRASDEQYNSVHHCCKYRDDEKH